MSLRFDRVVGRQIDSIEALQCKDLVSCRDRSQEGEKPYGVTLWKSPTRDQCLFNRKLPRSITTLKVPEAVNWRTTRTGGELKQSSSLLGWPSSNYFPKPSDDLILRVVTSVFCVLLPVENIDSFDSTNQ